MWGCIPRNQHSRRGLPTAQRPPKQLGQGHTQAHGEIPLPWGPAWAGALGKTLISAVAGELTLNFVVDKGHGKGRWRPLVCRESCILFQSGSSKRWQYREGVWVCVQNYCRTAYLGLYLLTLLMTSEGFPTHLLFLLHPQLQSYKMLPLHQSPIGAPSDSHSSGIQHPAAEPDPAHGSDAAQGWIQQDPASPCPGLS